jgi:branched-chain amino acid transport system ATP-binding protein
MKVEQILELKDVVVNYGPVEVLQRINISVGKGEIVALFGPNGAGKTTLLYATVGILPVASGEILFNGQSISRLPAEQVVRRGLTLVPEGRLLFPTMTTMDNLWLGAYHRRGRQAKEENRQTLGTILNLFPILGERGKQHAGTMSGGEQQMIAIGRGLMARPQLLLCDEPSLGLAPLMVRELMRTLAKLRAEHGLTILLAEQSVEATLKIADRGYLLSSGRVIKEGSSEELKSTEAIKASYLGYVPTPSESKDST